MKKQFVFLNVPSPKQGSQRDRELQNSKARSHAAAVSHARAKVKRSSVDGPALRHHLSYSAGVPLTDSTAIVGRSGLLTPPPSAFDRVLGPQPQSGLDDDDELSQDFSGSSIRRHDGSLVVNNRSAVGHQQERNHIDSIKAAQRNLPSGIALDPVPVSPHPGFGCYRSEFFSYIPYGQNTVVRRTVNFYWQTGPSTNDFACELFNVTNFFSSCLASLHNDLIYHAAIAAFGVFSERTMNLSPMSKELLYHHYLAVKKLQQHLKRKDAVYAEGLLSAILYLAVYETLVGNHAGSQKHFLALSQIVQARGGLRALSDDDDEKPTIMNAEAQTALITGVSVFEGQRRSFSATYPTYPFSADFVATVSSMPKGFHPLIFGGRLSYDCVAVLKQAVKTRLTDNGIAAQQQRAERRWIKGAYPDILEAVPILNTPDRDDILLEKMVCWALYMCCWLDADQLKPRSTLVLYHCARNYISKTLVLLSRKNDTSKLRQVDQNCIVWLYVLAIDSWRTSQTSSGAHSSEAFKLLEDFKDNFMDLSMDWRRIETTMRQFFVSENLLNFWRANWYELCAAAIST